MKWINISYIFPLLIIIYMMPYNSLIVKMTTLDSFFIAINFLIAFLNKELKEVDIINHNSSIYERSALDRYILYTIIQLIYTLTSSFFWVFNSRLSDALLLSVVPFITNYILKSYYFKIIIKKKEYFIKKMIAKNLTKIIRSYSKIYLDKDVDVKYKELMPLLNDYQRTIDYMYSILKTSLMLALLSKIKDYSPNFYYKLTKHIYIYKTGNMLKSFSTHNAKDILIAMINSRKWDELLKPNVQRAIMELYYANDQQINIIEDIFTRFNYKILKISTLWVISSLFNCQLIAPIGSVMFLLYRDDMSIKNINRLIGPILAFAYAFFEDSFFLISFISELSYNILFNPITKNIYFAIIRKISKNLKRLYRANYHNNLFFLLTMIYMLFLSSFTRSSISLVFGIHMTYNLILNQNIERTIIMILLFLTTYTSDFNIYHIILNNCILYSLNPVLNESLEKINEYIIKKIPDEKEKKMLKRQDSYVVVRSEPITNITNIEDICDKKVFELDKKDFLDEVSIKDDMNKKNDKIIIDDNFMDRQ